jgi:hypothetical protein
LTEDGRVLYGAREVTHLTEGQMDELCRALYPNDPVIRDAYTTAKKQTSFSGCQYDLTNISDASTPTEDGPVADEGRLLELGGPRLLELYRLDFNFGLAAAALGLREGALRKWFYRWRTRALRDGLTESDLLWVDRYAHKDEAPRLP